MSKSATAFKHRSWCATADHTIKPGSPDNGPCFTRYIETGKDASAWVMDADSGPHVVMFATPEGEGLTIEAFTQFCRDGLAMVAAVDASTAIPR